MPTERMGDVGALKQGGGCVFKRLRLKGTRENIMFEGIDVGLGNWWASDGGKDIGGNPGRG